jgi:LPS O-antigen subunit length determinant protein (WzzB/FepE family)
MKVKETTTLLGVLTVSLVIAIVACASPTYESELTIDQIKAGALNALELIERYKLDMAMSMSVSAGSEFAMDQLSSITTGAIDKTSLAARCM